MRVPTMLIGFVLTACQPAMPPRGVAEPDTPDARPMHAPPTDALSHLSLKALAPENSSLLEIPTAVADPVPTGPMSEPLACGLHNPMPGAYAAGYQADTGLDLAGMGQPVFAIAGGEVDYAEAGHTAWTSPRDDDRAIRIVLDEPLKTPLGEVTHVWYAHLAELAFEQAEGAPTRRRVVAGEYLGKSGRANGMYHLHIGLLLGGETSQAWGTYLLEDAVRSVLCGLGHKSRLPVLATANP